MTGTTAICTTNNTVLCVTTMSQAAPCAEEKTLCINTTIPCLDPENPLCQNITNQQKETIVNVPCFTNLTVDINLLNETGNAQNKDFKYCVTTMALAGPEYKICSESEKENDFRNVLKGIYKNQ
ncbi:hypothetical protein NQ314_019454 [Rhamnusium bicolor]|uniref:Uncharacterized protein n=1 Tax=Rhamnusium bicolor TaxID=1586634 RepID=A0AAV8WP22_9CUCU|nr:hypothetical protein NQ314_019454 [Rhamnusium bicolor]